MDVGVRIRGGCGSWLRGLWNVGYAAFVVDSYVSSFAQCVVRDGLLSESLAG